MFSMLCKLLLIEFCWFFVVFSSFMAASIAKQCQNESLCTVTKVKLQPVLFGGVS